MELKMPHKRERGQVGIGTLIVFIAMVLVAAIAAGVLINTAGFLQSQSEQTGQQSSSQVTNRLQVVNVVGDRIAFNQVEVINMTVKKAPGSEDVDLEGVTLQYVSNDQIEDIVHTNASQAGSGNAFVTTAIRDDDTSITASQVLNDETDRAKITLDINSSSQELTSVDTGNINALGEGQQVSVQLTTASGGETTATLTAPDTLSSKTSVALAP